MPYPARPPAGEQPESDNGVFSILDKFINNGNPVISGTARLLAGPIAGAPGGLQATKTVWDAAGTAIGFALGRGATPASAGIVALESSAKGAKVTQEDLDAYTAKAAAQTPGHATGFTAPIVLGMQGADVAWNYGFNRPASTALLLTDPNSSLYNGNRLKAVDENGQPINEDLEEGFQLQDIQRAWNRSDKVSFGQAVAANDLVNTVPMIGGIAPLINAIGGTANYDPWSDSDMEAAQNNPFYVALSGGTDLAAQLIVPPAVRAARIAGMRRVGLTNTVRSAEDLAAMRADFDNYDPANPNPYGALVHEIAASTNEGRIRANQMVANNVGADKGRLAKVLAETDDPSTVNEILLANMGDVQAIRNLADAAPDHVWTLAEADNVIRANARQGVPFRPVGEELNRVNQVFDSALERNRYFGTLREELTTPDGRIKVNSTWKPTSSMTVETVRTKLNGIQYAVKTGNYEDAPQWVQQRLTGRGGDFVTTRLQWAGSKSPLGHVSNSGARPDEKLIEFRAQMDSVPELRGNRPVVIGGRETTANVWRSEWESRIATARDGELPDLWTQMEHEVIDMLAATHGVDPASSRSVVDAFRTRIGDEMQYLRDSDGYLFDEDAGRIVVDPVTARQLLNSFQTMPLAEIRNHLIQEKSVLNSLAKDGQTGAIGIYDGVQKVFRVDVLFRPGYTGKNSVIEPLISRFLAHGTILADEGLWATLENVGANWARRFKRVGYYAQIHKLMDESLMTGAKKSEVKALLAERHNLQQVIDSAVAEMDGWNKPGQWPGLADMYGEEVRGMLFEAQMKINSIDSMLDNSLPEWRQVVEPANLFDLRDKLQEYKAILGENPDYVRMLHDQIDQIEQAGRARVKSPKEVLELRQRELQRDLAGLRGRQTYFSEDFKTTEGYDYTGHSVATDGTQARGASTNPVGPGDTARGRDYQGIQLQRQIESLQQQLDEVEEALKTASDEVEPKYTVNERVERQRLIHTVARIEHYADPVSREYPSMNRYGGESMGGVGVDRTYRGMVPVQRLLDMPGNAVDATRLGAFDKNLMQDPVMVEFDAVRGRMYVGEGNHRVAAAAAAGVENIPVRVVRRNITDADVAYIESQGGRVADVEPGSSPWKNGQGHDYWPPEMHPRFAGIEADTMPEIRAAVDALQAQYDEIAGARADFTITQQMEELQTLEAAMAELDGRLGVEQAVLREAEGRNRAIGGRLGSQGYRGSGQGDMVVNIGGHRYDVPKAFSERAYTYGSGYRAEASAQTTTRLTYDPSARADFETGRWRRSNGPVEMTPDNPRYWDTLAHVGNRFFREDRLVQLRLEGWSRERIAVWLKTPEGQAYQKGMGENYLEPIDNYDPIRSRNGVIDEPAPVTSDVRDIRGRTKGAGSPAEPSGPAPRSTDMPGGSRRPTHVMTASTTRLDEVLRLVDQYFPDEAVRKQLAEKEMSAGELQAAMGGRTDLSRIAGDDLNYHPSLRERVADRLNRTMDKVWQWIATMPEDRIARWPFYQHEFRNQLTQRAKILQEQGIDLADEAQWDALRQASHRASLQELEKTFYNIRRYGTPVYASRFLMTFPGAFFNSIYRYGRFAMREPERMIQLGVLGGDILKLGGVDADGNHTKNLMDIKYFAIPGTASEHSPGIMIPVESLASLGVNYPALSIGIVSATTLKQMQDPTFSSTLESLGGPVYNTLFPYGVGDNPIANFVGAWQKDGWRFMNQFLGVNDEDRNRTTIQIYDYRMYQWDQGGQEGPPPTIEDAGREAGAFYGQQAVTKFLSAFSINRPLPGDYLRKEWSAIEKKYNGDVNAARDEFIKLHGQSALYFTMSDNKRTAYVPATEAAYNRIFVENPDLARELVKIDPDNPDMVGLLAYGTGGEYNPAIGDALRNTPLPGDDQPVLATMTPEDYEAYSLKQIGFDSYTAGQSRYNAERLRLVKMRDAAQSEREKQQYRDLLNGLDTEWASWVGELEASNQPFAKARTENADAGKQADMYLKTILADKDFVAAHRDDPEWQKVNYFLIQQDTAKSTYASLTNDADKAAFKQQFTDYVLTNFVDGDADFDALWSRYFAADWQTERMAMEESAA